MEANKVNRLAVTFGVAGFVALGGAGALLFWKSRDAAPPPRAAAPSGSSQASQPAVEEDHDDHAEGEGRSGGAEHAGHDEHGEEAHVRLTEADVKEFGLRTRVAGPGKIAAMLSVPGKIVTPSEKIAHVVPRVPGYARQVLIQVGDRVSEGQRMAVLESPELGAAKVAYLSAVQEAQLAGTDLRRARTLYENVGKLLKALERETDPQKVEVSNGGATGEYRSRLISAHSELAFARATYDREKLLFEKKISSGSEVLAAETAHKKAEAEYASARDQISFEIRRGLQEAQRKQDVVSLALSTAEKRLHVLGLGENEVRALAKGDEPEERLALYEIRAPISGTVTEQHITRGEALKDDTPAYLIANQSAVWVDLSVFPKDVNSIRPGIRAVVSTSEGLTAEGKVTYVGPQVSEETRSGLARVVLPNPKGLWKAGMFVTGQLAVGEASAAVRVPKSALQRIEERTVVFVREGDGFEARRVAVGRSTEAEVEITSGLQPGEVYVSEGAFALKAQLAKGSFGDGHAH